jgi:predicted PurR-regulated permease PerM
MKTTKSVLIKNMLILFLILAGAHYAKEFFIPIAIGIVLATVFLPSCKWMEKKGLHKGLAAFTCLLLLLIAIGIVTVLISWQLSSVVYDSPMIKQKVMETFDNIQEYIFNHIGISAVEQSQILKKEQPSITNILQVVTGSITQVVTGFILMLVYIFGFLYYRNHIKSFILKLTSPSKRNEMVLIIGRTGKVSQQYLVGLFKMIVCLWIMYGIGFTLLGIKNAFFFAILCGLLEIIPFIGNITGTLLTVFVSALEGSGFLTLGGIAVVYGTVQFIQGWVLEPMIVGHQVKINPFATIISLVIGELVWGIAGIFLAIPITAMFKIVCDHTEALKPYGFLIGEIETYKEKE